MKNIACKIGFHKWNHVMLLAGGIRIDTCGRCGATLTTEIEM